MKVHTFYYKDSPVSFKNGMVNATEMSNAFGKKPIDYLKSRSAKTYFYSVAYGKVLDVTQVDNKQGTWMCEDLALDFARWLSLEARDWLELRIKGYKKIEQNELNNEKQEFDLPKTYLEALKELVRVEEEKEILKLQVAEYTKFLSIKKNYDKKNTFRTVEPNSRGGC